MGNSVSVKQYIFISVLYTLGNLYVIVGSVQFKHDFWTSFVIGALLSVPFLYIYTQIQKLFPGQNLYNIIITVFGKVWGKAITAFFALYALYLGALALRSCSEFIILLNLTKTPLVALMGFILIICIMLARCGIRMVGKCSLYLFPVAITILIGTSLLSMKYADPTNMLPLVIEEPNSFFQKCFSSGAMPFGEFVVLTSVMTREPQKFKNAKVCKARSNFWPLFSSAAISLGIILIAYFRNYLVLGPQSHALYYFPSYEAVSIVSIGNFLFRIELFVGLYLSITSLLRVSVLIISLAEGLCTLFNCGSQKEMATPAGILIFTLGVIMFKNTEQLTEWVVYYPYFLIPLVIIIPLIILVGGLIKSRKNKGNSNLSADFSAGQQQ